MFHRNRVAALTAALCLSTGASGAVVYVDRDATGADDGTSWTNAFITLRTALDAVAPGDEVWVAEGLYIPTDGIPFGGSQSESFLINEPIRLYGGFDGTETSLDERAGLFEQTILSGDRLGDDGPDFTNIGDNSYRVVSVFSDDVTIDGFVIERGNRAPPTGSNEGGGGLGFAMNAGYATIRNVVFRHNRGFGGFGGGGAVLAKGSEPVSFVRCVFEENRHEAEGLGGGGAVAGAVNQHLTFVGCIFRRNVATDGFNTSFVRGGAIYHRGDVVLSSCVFVANRAVSGSVAAGGAAYSTDTMTIDHCTFVGNVAKSHPMGTGIAAGVFIDEVGVISNSILWDNQIELGPAGTSPFGDDDQSEQIGVFGNTVIQVHHSAVEGWDGTIPGQQSSGANPILVDADGADNILGTADDDLRLHPTSPYIDAGANAFIPRDYEDVDLDGVIMEPTPLDVAGNPRALEVLAVPDSGTGPGPISDVGAFEHVGELCQTNLGFAKPGDLRIDICGDDLTEAGSVATFQLTGLAASSPFFLAVGGTFQPIPIQGFTLVPGPPLTFLPLVADMNGNLVTGVFGLPTPPTSLYVQALTPTSVSNGVELTIGL